MSDIEELQPCKFMLCNSDAKTSLEQFDDNTFHMAVTSPPYWALRDYFSDGQLGQEKTPEEYVEDLVSILREVKRVLRKDGTLWLNIGDSYNNNSGFCRGTKGWKRNGRDQGSADKKAIKHSYIKKKELFGVPWMVAFSLQKDGWYLRCDIVWKKSNPMPDGAKDRPTHGHEYLFLLSKSPKYFYDYYGVSEETDEHPEGIQGFGANNQEGTFRQDQERTFEHYGKRNMRSVWETSVSSYGGKHFATFPQKLIDPCVCASTSEKGCCVECGTPWERKFEKEKVSIDKKHGKYGTNNVDMFGDMAVEQYQLQLVEKGWEKKCKCKTDETKPCIVLDPFSGMATTGLAAFKYGQSYVGVELNPEYLKESRKRLKKDAGDTVVEVTDIKEL